MKLKLIYGCLNLSNTSFLNSTVFYVFIVLRHSEFKFWHGSVRTYSMHTQVHDPAISVQQIIHILDEHKPHSSRTLQKVITN